MDGNLSVSKGVFPMKKYKIGERSSFHKNKSCRSAFKKSAWYKAFHEIWSSIENNVSQVNQNTFKKILMDLTSFVGKIKAMPLLTDEIPTGILLAGVNLPDHHLLLQKLIDQLESVTPYISTIWSRDAGNSKSLTEEVVYQIVNNFFIKNNYGNFPEIKKSNCTFQVLHAWHEENSSKDTPLVIIIPDFEGFSPKILHDFILILSSYWETMKFVLIFGVATSLHIVHRSLSYDATSKLKFQVFHTETQQKILSDVLDSIVLTPSIPFKLTGRAFSSLVQVFLFYDFSVNSFLQSYKVCMWKHFFEHNEKILCCNKKDIIKRIDLLTSEDLRNLKSLESVKDYLERTKQTETTDKGFKKILYLLLEQFNSYMNNFLLILKCLHQMSTNIPFPSGCPIGKNFREFYELAVSDKNKNLCESKQYKETIQFISCLSKEELLTNIKHMISVLEKDESAPEEVLIGLNDYFDSIKDASLEALLPESPRKLNFSQNESRYKFLENLKTVSQKSRSSPYAEVRKSFMEFLDSKIFAKYLKSPHQKPLHEIFCYNDVYTVNNNLRGSMKALIFKSLSDPHYILRCKCCKSDGNCIRTSYPDLCIIFQLHLERKKMINLYDWLQSYLSVLNPDNTDDDENDVDPLLHARFTQAVADLQFLGFIKATRLKTDHVKRLTC